MAERDPRLAILADLAEPSATRARRPGSDDPTRPAASLGERPFSADPATVRVLKERGIPGRRLFAVTFEDEASHQPWFWLVAAERDDPTGAWVASGGAGGAGSDPEPKEPRVNLAGWWGRGRFYAGGRVLAAGKEVAWARLRTANGLELEDDTNGGVALFLTDRPADTPATVDIHDRQGRLLARHSAGEV